jgi:hypothetical protein
MPHRPRCQKQGFFSVLRRFDLIVMSAFLSREEQENVISAALDTPTLVLTGLTFAEELLSLVEQQLAPGAKK